MLNASLKISIVKTHSQTNINTSKLNVTIMIMYGVVCVAANWFENKREW